MQISQNGWWCKYNKKNNAGANTGFVDVNPTESDLEHAVETVGPVSVAIDASLWSFNYYNGGMCSQHQLIINAGSVKRKASDHSY